MRHCYIGCRTISVLTENYVSLAPSRVFAIKCIGAMQKHHHIRVLFQRAGFTQVRDLRALVRALLGTTVELTDGDHWNVQFFCH